MLARAATNHEIENATNSCAFLTPAGGLNRKSNRLIVPSYVPQSSIGVILLTSPQENPGQEQLPKPPDLQASSIPSSPTLNPIDSVLRTTGGDEDENKCQDLWMQAYDKLKERETDLVTDYEKHLSSCKYVPTTATDPLSTQESTKATVAQLLENREGKQWRLPWLEVDVKVREQLEKLVKFALWSDDIVKQALSAQPHAALAWSAVSILLPVS
jgi:hypothetical protein